MAHPIKLAGNSVNYFISQWLYGLKPSLRLNTDEDGSILITSEVASFPVLSLDDTQYSGNNYKPRRRRSGKSARHRRNLIRNSNVNRDDLFDNSDSDHTPASAQTAITAVLESSSTETPGRKELSAVNVVSVDISHQNSLILRHSLLSMRNFLKTNLIKLLQMKSSAGFVMNSSQVGTTF